MTRSDDRDEASRQMRDARRIEPFFMPGSRNQLVKVLGIRRGIPQDGVTGYVTQQAFLIGLTPREIGAYLGLKETECREGCRVFKLLSPPGPSKIVYELTTKYPGGLVYNPTFAPEYLPSPKNYIHQWRLLGHVQVALPGQLVAPNDRFVLIP